MEAFCVGLFFFFESHFYPFLGPLLLISVL